jgi:hypothetical protein
VSCNVLIFSLNESSWKWDLWCWLNCELFTRLNFSIKTKWNCDFALYRINHLSRRAASNETNCFKKIDEDWNFYQYMMIIERFDDDSHDLRQHEQIIFRRVWNKWWIVHVVYANHFCVVVDFFNDHFEHIEINHKIFNFSAFDVYLIVNVKTDFDVIFRVGTLNVASAITWPTVMSTLI